MSVAEVESPDHEDLLRLLAWDARASTSIFFCWASARDNARRAREVIPLDLWECINTTWQQLLPGQLQVAGADRYLDWARTRSSLFNGIARGTMVRDEGWQFLSMGRALEQADMTSRLVASASLSSGGTQWPSVLRGAGGHDAFPRTYKGLHTDREAAQFLILDPRFPRSVMHGLIAASDCLRKIVRRRTAAPRGGSATVERQLGQLRARLEYADLDELLGMVMASAGAAVGLGTDQGAYGTIGLGTELPLTRRLVAGISTGASFANAENMAFEFGVTREQSEVRRALQESGDPRLGGIDVAAYAPGAGLKDMQASASLAWLLTPRSRVVLFAQGTRLSDEASRSPLVQSRTGTIAGLAIGYGF